MKAGTLAQNGQRSKFLYLCVRTYSHGLVAPAGCTGLYPDRQTLQDNLPYIRTCMYITVPERPKWERAYGKGCK